jgi:hypothetical protein
MALNGYALTISSPDRLSRKQSTRGRRVDQLVITRCSHACLALTAYCQCACPMWNARHLITDTRKFVDHAAFTRGPRAMHWLTAQRLLVIMRYSLVDNKWTPCAEAVQGGCRVTLMSCDLKAHLQEIVRCSFKLKLDLDIIPSLSN